MVFLLSLISKLVDTNVIEEKDIGVNFFLQKADVGKLRANVVVPRLRELNLVCQVSAADKIDESILIGHNALVVTQVLPLSQLIQLNNLCRVHKLSFFYVFTSGVSTDIFVDHGVEHIINDPNGDKPVQKLITDIQINNERRECLIRYETPEGEQPIALTNGFIDISEVKGIVGINGHYNIIREPNDPVKTIRISFESSNTTVDKYISGGIITEKKVPFDYPMDTFEAKLKNPGNPFAEPPTMVLTDLINFGSEIQQHVAYYAVLKFFSDKNKLPNVFSDVDSENVLEIAKSLLANKEIELDEGFEIDTKLLLRFFYFIFLYFFLFYFTNLNTGAYFILL
jgi:molybdopterin/thiamine biosynthesis adenylyltransferase